MSDSPFSTRYLHSYYSKDASLSFGFYDGRPNIAAFPRNSDSKKPIMSLALTGAACMWIGNCLKKIISAAPDTTLTYVNTYKPRDGGDPKQNGVVNVFKDSKNRIGIEVTNPATGKSASFLIRAPASFNLGDQDKQEESYKCEAQDLSTFFHQLAPWAKVISPREKRDDNKGSSRSSGSSSGGSSRSNDDDELW